MNELDIQDRDIRYFNVAEIMSKKSNFHKALYRIGCVAVLNNKIIAKGCNCEKTNPLQLKYSIYFDRDFPAKNYKPTMHAEVNCLQKIINADISWNKVKIYLYRGCKSRPYGNSKPCSSCMALIKDLGIKHIYYTTDYGFAHEIII